MAHTTRAAARAQKRPFADIERDDDLEETRNEGATQNDASSSDNDDDDNNDVSVFFKDPVLAAEYAADMEAIRQCSSSPDNDDDTDDDSVLSKDPVWAAEYAADMEAIRQCSSSPDNADDDYEDYDDDNSVSTQHDPKLAAKDPA
jgi:hypothetical protein